MTKQDTNSRLNAFFHNEQTPDVVDQMHADLLNHAHDADWQNAMDHLWQGTAEATMPDHELDAAIIFMTCEENSYMTGNNVVIDGGWTCT